MSALPYGDLNRFRGALPAEGSAFPQPPALLERSRRLSTRIAELQVATEREFLQIGAHLADFHNRSKAVLEKSRTIAVEILREKVPAILLQLQEVFHSLEENRRLMTRVAAEETQALHSALEQIERIREQARVFRQTTKMLQNLAVATRIESCRDARGIRDFAAVGVDLKTLADRIGHRCSEVLQSVDTLDQCRHHARERVRDLHDGRGGEAARAVARAESSLNTLSARTEEAVRFTSAVNLIAERPSREIEGMVVSLQCQDIVRQKLEHIRLAVADLGRGQTGHGDEVCRVQRAQLEQARDELIEAVRQIAGSLRNLGDQVEEVANETGRAAGLSTGEGSSIIQNMAEATTLIAHLLQEGTVVRSEVSAALGKVAAASDFMSGLVAAIEQLGAELKVLALNAGIRAAHGGHLGASLGVIAKEIQQISEEALSRARLLSAELRLVLSIGGRFGAIESESSSGHLTAAALGLLHDLQELDGELAAGLAALRSDAASLASHLHEVASSWTLHHAVDREIASAIEDLEGIRRQLRTASDGSTDGLQRLWERYTMQSEREIHRAVHTRAGRPGTAGECETRRFSDSEFGESVEIF